MRSFALISSVSVLAACGHMGAPATAPVPEAIKGSPAERVALTLGAKGVQIYECRANAEGKLAWAFVAPEADLFDRSGAKVGTHYAGPTWEMADGSKIVGTVKSRADAPQAGAIPWLLLVAKSTGGAGKLAATTSVQRVNTAGGSAPAAGCVAAADAGKRERVAYTADYHYLQI
jgi:hypothetical protein